MRSVIEQYVKEFINEAVRRKFDMHIPTDLLSISDAFKAAGEELFVVGGSVRDAVLGKEPKDYDVATGADPDKVTAIVSTLPNHKIIEVGKSFGVVKVITPEGNEYEIATFRKDIGAGRRPDSVEYTSIDKDVMRRDLTINALFYDIDKGEIVDYVGGLEDIESGTVRAVGNPQERFDEDRLRVLRAIRFAARMGSKLDPATSAAIKQDNTLAGVSPERVRDEFIKCVKSAKTVRVLLDILDEYDMWPRIFPGLVVSEGQFQSRDVSVLLACLLHENDPVALAKRLNALKYNSQEVSQTSLLVRLLDLSPDTAYKLKKAANAAHVSDDQILQFANDVKSIPEDVLQAFILYEPSINGADVAKDGFSGAELGRELERRERLLFLEML